MLRMTEDEPKMTYPGSPLTPKGLAQAAVSRVSEFCQRVAEASMALDEARRQHAESMRRLEQCQGEFEKSAEALSGALGAFRDGANGAI